MADPKQRIVVDGIEFGSIVQFPRILRSVTAAMQPPRLVVALLMVVALVAVGATWDGVAGHGVHPEGLLAGRWSETDRTTAQIELRTALRVFGGSGATEEELTARGVIDEITERHRNTRGALEGAELAARDDTYRAWQIRLAELRPRGAFDATSAEVTHAFHRAIHAVVTLNLPLLIASGDRLFCDVPCALWEHECTFTILYGLFLLLVLAIGGAALSRMAACEIAGFERLRVRDAFDFALGHWPKLILSLLLPIIITASLALLLVLFGLLFAPWLDVIGGPLYGLALVIGFVVAFLLIGYVVGFSLLVPAVACENCDASEAQQRVYAYVLNRPLHLLGYAFVVLVGLALGYLLVALFANVMLGATAVLTGMFFDHPALATGGLSLFDFAERSDVVLESAWHDRWAAGAVGFWETVVIDLVAAWVVSYLFTSATSVYLLMRRACDGQDVEEIWRPGLTPGTLVPLPRTRVDEEAPEDAS